jgi:hypothetical protein
MLLAAAVLGPAEVEASPRAVLQFQTERECLQAMGPNAHKCLQWFDIASARVARDGRQFAYRVDCEAVYGACQLRAPSAGRTPRQPMSASISFVPALLGIQIKVTAAGVATIMPIVGNLAQGGRVHVAAGRQEAAPSKHGLESLEPDKLVAMARAGDNDSAAGDQRPLLTYPVPKHRIPKRRYLTPDL